MAQGLPPIGKNYPLPNTPRGRFAQQVALRTGLNPWVIYAWTVAENNDTSVKRRPWNYLNFKSEDGKGAVLGGVHSANCDKATDGGCFPGFGSMDDGVAATVAFINKHFPKIRQAANQPASKQIDVIGASGWGTSASHLRQLYNQFLVALLRQANTPGGDAPGTTIGGLPGAGVATGKPGGDPNTIPGNTTLPDPQGGQGGLIGSVVAFVAFILNPHNWLRAGQVIAGAAAILAGAFIISRGEMASMVTAR